MAKQTPPNYTVRFETSDPKKYAKAIEFVEQFAMSKGRGETSNYDLCYFLDDEKKGRVKLIRPNLPLRVRVIELTDSVDDEVINGLLKLLCN
jgi:hypothetical protein